MANNTKTVIIGLDGVPFGMLKNFAGNGVMPNTQKIIEEGLFVEMRSSVPEISSVAWSSIITGKNPGEHGIFGFVDLHPCSYKMRFPNYNDLKARPFWELYGEKSVIINVPSTYPVREMNGVHISGFVSIDFEKSIHPKSLIAQLKSMDYRLDVDAQKAHDSIDLFLEDLDKSLDKRIEAYQYLWGNINWKTFMFVFTGTDRLMHFLFDAYEDKNHKHHDAFINHFKKIDGVIGRTCSKISDEDNLLLLSDHGFERLEKDVYINYLLAKEGLLTFKPDSEPNLMNIDIATKAFALDPARIYINQKGKYPAGGIEPDEKETCLKELESLFASLEVDGKKVIKEIWRKEDIYSGPYLEKAPDLILIADKGFNLKGAMTSKALTGKGPFTGKHTYEDAFLLVKNKDIVSDFSNKPTVIDAGKLIKSLANNR